MLDEDGIAEPIPAPIVIGSDSRSRTSFREIVVDFFGGLVPGIAFLLGLIPAILVPLAFLLPAISGISLLEAAPLRPQVPNSTILALLIILPALFLFFVAAYVAGQVFFRQGPKEPDVHSYRSMPKGERAESMVRKDGKKLDVQFPYRFLYEYLHDRGLEYLAEIIPWRGSTRSHLRHRTKHFINALKIRLEFTFPDRMATIARNEAHVRLSSSMWYVAGQLDRIASLGLRVAVVAIPIDLLVVGSAWPVRLLWLPLLPWATRYASQRMRRGIERALHYQREREVLFILETAYWANEMLPLLIRRKKKQGHEGEGVPDMFAGLSQDSRTDSAEEDADQEIQETTS